MSLFGRRVRPQQFRYIPQYWDQAKEQREARAKARMQRENGNDAPEAVKARISHSFKHPRHGAFKSHRNTQMRSNLILLAAIIILCYLAWRIITGNMALIEKWLG